MKKKLFSILALLSLMQGMSLTSYATTYESLTVGMVLHVGDAINSSTEYNTANSGMYLSPAYNPFTLVRADIVPPEMPWDNPSISESETGAYYLFKCNNSEGYFYFFNPEGGIDGLGVYVFEATATSDGIYVESLNGSDVTFAVHEAPSTVAVTGVTLSQTSASLTAGGAALELTPTVAPEGATDKTVKWSVEQTGDFVALYTDEACTQAVGTDAIAAAKVYVKPLAAGQATITVTTNDGAKTATCAVTVAEPTYNVTFKAGTEDVVNWTATPSSATKGQTVTVKYTGTKKVKSVKAIKK